MEVTAETHYKSVPIGVLRWKTVSRSRDTEYEGFVGAVAERGVLRASPNGHKGDGPVAVAVTLLDSSRG